MKNGKGHEWKDQLDKAMSAHLLAGQIEADRTAWRLSPSAFVAHAAEAAGLSLSQIPELAAVLDRKDLEHARTVVMRLAHHFRPAQFAPDCPSWKGWLSAIDVGLLGGAGLSPGRATAIAAWQSVKGYDPTSWRGRATREGEAAEQLEKALAERARLVEWLDSHWRDSPFVVSAVDDAGRGNLSIHGVALIPGAYAQRLLEHLANQPEWRARAA